MPSNRCSRCAAICKLPTEPLPLVVLTKPFFPRATEHLLQFTWKFLPGASAPCIEPPKRRIANANDEHTIVIASTKEFTTSLDPEQHQPEEATAVAPRQWRWRWLIQLVLLGVFSGLLLMTLAMNGYVAQNSEGKFPQTVSKHASYWPGDANNIATAVRCGEDALECLPFATEYWIGLHCRGDYDFVRGSTVRGSGKYTADSSICASAAHAGVISGTRGGCFEARLAGAANWFESTYNADERVNSTEFGWFPRSIEFRAVEGGRFCENTYWSADLVVSVAFIVFYLVWRIDAAIANWVLVQFGFAYAGFKNARFNGEFLIVANELLGKEFTLIPACYMLFHLFAPAFCPNPTRFPMEAMSFAALFFIVIHLNDFEMAFRLDGFTLTTDLFTRADHAYLVFFIVLIIVVLIGGLFQTYVLIRAGLGKQYVIGIVCFALVLIVLALPTAPQLSFHFHHFFFGLCLCALARGQRVFSMAIQAIGLALFVEGVALYHVAPLFDVDSTATASTSGYYLYPTSPISVPINEASEYVFEPVVFTSALFLDDSTIELQWALPSELAFDWDCAMDVGYVVPEIWRTMYELSLRNWTEAIPKAERNFYILQNGILQDTALPRTARNFTTRLPSKDMYSRQPLVYDIVLVDSWVSTLVKLPMPFPLSPHIPYHPPNATLCERMYGIYSRTQELRMNHTRLVWW